MASASATREGHRLLDEDMLARRGAAAMVSGGVRPLGVQMQTGVHVGAREQRRVVRLAGHAELGNGGGGGLRRIGAAGGDEARTGGGGDGLRVIARDHARPDDRDPTITRRGAQWEAEIVPVRS